jgi:hypothetical protein
MERKSLWPKLSHLNPDILLSIGTGFDSSLKHSRDRDGQGRKTSLGGVSYVKRLLRIAMDQLESNLDCQKAWATFISPLNLEGSESARKYRRLNRDYPGNLPKLDEVERMEHFEKIVRDYFIGEDIMDEIAITLIASLFYFETEKLHQMECEG